MQGVLPPSEEHSLTFKYDDDDDDGDDEDEDEDDDGALTQEKLPLVGASLSWCRGPPCCQCGTLAFSWWCLTPVKRGPMAPKKKLPGTHGSTRHLNQQDMK